MPAIPQGVPGYQRLAGKLRSTTASKKLANSRMASAHSSACKASWIGLANKEGLPIQNTTYCTKTYVRGFKVVYTTRID